MFLKNATIRKTYWCYQNWTKHCDAQHTYSVPPSIISSVQSILLQIQKMHIRFPQLKFCAQHLFWSVWWCKDGGSIRVCHKATLMGCRVQHLHLFITADYLLNVFIAGISANRAQMRKKILLVGFLSPKIITNCM